jgi:hypothetical protein
MEFYKITWTQFLDDLRGFSHYLRGIINAYHGYSIYPAYIYTIPRGGTFLYWWLKYMDNSLVMTIQPEYAKFILDDICDTGKTLKDPRWTGIIKVVMYKRLTVVMTGIEDLHAFKLLETDKYILLPFEDKEQILRQKTFRTGDDTL